MDLKTGILQTAQALGMNPVDLATIISYETAGTFDPTKAGPTTQWGQHRGLIQWGEPQAQEYGVNWSDPIGSQLGPDGAIVRYYKDRGWQPGMGILDAYSIVNAGAPGRYSASDANNGGAPGTVADKVNNQMGPHRAKAEALLGGSGSDVMIGNSGGDMLEPKPERMGILGRALGLSPERRDELIVALEGLTMNPNMGLVGQANKRMETREADARTAAQVNKTAAWLRSMGRDDLAQAIEAGAVDPQQAAGVALTPQDTVTGPDPTATSQWLVQNGRNDLAQLVAINALDPSEAVKMVLTGQQPTEYGLQPIYGTDAEGNTVVLQVGKNGTATTTQLPEGVTPNLGIAAEERARGTAVGKAQGEAQTNLGGAIAKAQQALDLIDQIRNDPALPSITGNFQGRAPAGIPLLTGGQDGADLSVKIDQLQGKVFLDAFEALKGGGQITEVEGLKAERAQARLNRAQSTEEYKAALDELAEVVAAGMERARAKAGGVAPVATTTLDTPAPAVDDPLGLR